MTLRPNYRIPPRLALQAGGAVLLGRPRSVLADSLAAVADGRPEIEFLGLEQIPSRAGCLVVCNHYSRSGFGAWWIGLGISAAFGVRRDPDVEADIHWVMTSAWTFPDERWKNALVTPLTRVLFSRVAACYGFIIMPPMPPAPHEVGERAMAVLRAIRLAKGEGICIGLAPEGRDNGQQPGDPPEGVGEFIAHLCKAGLVVLPVGVSESGEKYVISFGTVFSPVIPEKRSERDTQVAAQVMSAIKKQLP
jgi:1-acyl-sn-glycerol-3-phosphate acyltransferase